jgi:hypothetical protein
MRPRAGGRRARGDVSKRDRSSRVRSPLWSGAHANAEPGALPSSARTRTPGRALPSGTRQRRGGHEGGTRAGVAR